jgi:hypothetical protein
MSSAYDILNSLNNKSNNSLTVANINYLESLREICHHTIDKLHEFNFTEKLFYEIKCSFGKDIEFGDYNEFSKIETINFIKQTLNTIPLLMQKLVTVPDKKLREEYIIFHNNLVKKIKSFINCYFDFVVNISTMEKKILEKIRIDTDALNILVYNYNGNLMCQSDPNFPRNHARLNGSIELLMRYHNYLTKICDAFISVRTLFKKIDTAFLKML